MSESGLECRQCGAVFTPQEVRRLSPSSHCREQCRYQDLMIGECPDCGCKEYAWAEIGYMYEVLAINRISYKKHKEWDARLAGDEIRLGTRTGVGAVQGSQKQFPWRFLPMIPVA